MFQKLGKLLDFLFKGFAAMALVGMVGMVFYNAVLRYVFNSSYPQSEEYSRFLFVWVSYLGIILAYKNDAHVSMTVVTDNVKGKTLFTLKMIAHFIILATIGFLLYGSFRYTLSSNYLTPATHTNFMFVSSAALVMSFSVFILTIFKIYEDFKKGADGADAKKDAIPTQAGGN